jgi:hypothetical protein
VGRDGGKYEFDLGQARRDLFLREGLDRWNQIEPPREIRFSAQLVLQTLRYRAVIDGLDFRKQPRHFFFIEEVFRSSRSTSLNGGS